MPPCSATMRGVGPAASTVRTSLSDTCSGSSARMRASSLRVQRHRSAAPPAGRRLASGRDRRGVAHGHRRAGAAGERPARRPGPAPAQRASSCAAARPAARSMPGCSIARPRASTCSRREALRAKGDAEMQHVVRAWSRPAPAGTAGRSARRAGSRGRAVSAHCAARPDRVQVERGDAGPHRKVLRVQTPCRCERREPAATTAPTRRAPAGSAGTGGRA